VAFGHGLTVKETAVYLIYGQSTTVEAQPSPDVKMESPLTINIRMTEQIPYAVAESLFNRLASATFLEYGRIYGVMDELERLKNSVECIRVVLLDAQEKQEQNWIRRLEDVLHRADDLLDEFIIEDIRYKGDAAVVVKQTDSLRSKSISFLLESDITGREDDKKEIINLLRQPHGNISSVAIVGIGGIGKTTIAR
ncbi:putative NBS-LRR resistance protein, partial [Trifolium pratense]